MEEIIKVFIPCSPSLPTTICSAGTQDPEAGTATTGDNVAKDTSDASLRGFGRLAAKVSC